MIRTAIYGRYSDVQQRDSSIEQQFRLLHKCAEQNGWTIVAEFEDRAFTGSNAFRPGFQALREAALRGEFDLVLSESVDRLSRDLEDLAGFYKRLKYRGGSMYTLLEGVVTEMTIAFKGGMSSITLSDLGARVHRGHNQNILAAKARAAGPTGTTSTDNAMREAIASDTTASSTKSRRRSCVEYSRTMRTAFHR